MNAQTDMSINCFVVVCVCMCVCVVFCFYAVIYQCKGCLIDFGVDLILKVPVNNYSFMLGRSHSFLGINSTFWFKCVMLKDTTWQPE